MAARRNTTPLFEIVSRNGSADAAPVDRHEAPGEPARRRPNVSPDVAEDEAVVRHRSRGVDAQGESEASGFSPAREADSGRDIPRTMGRISVASGTVRLPLNYAYIGLSGVLVVALGAWTLGYVFGGQNADEKARREIETAAGGPALRDPLVDGARGDGTEPSGGETGDSLPRPAGGERAAAPGVGSGAAALNVPEGLPAITSRRTAYLAPGGFFEGEPRTPGLNYFCLVSRLPEADAARALDFLARNGVVAMGLEHERSTANNRLFDLYTLTAIPSENFRTNETRSSHEGLMAELGRRWRAEERGTSDFGQPQWYRFNP
jgi:hypothetical protein